MRCASVEQKSVGCINIYLKPISVDHFKYFSAGLIFGYVSTFICPLSAGENAVFQ
jgi:hypothetical protein